ncbi:MAG: oligosaccharide flippase family protein [Phycisphaerae bacterium]|nr:oligosaccharide flippase family protein [Phycisphaerae bacterium]
MIPGITKLLGGSSLKAKCAKGAMALGIGTVGGRTLRFLRILILARILAPAQFGVIAIIIASLRVLEAFTEVGVKQSVVQNKQGAEREYLNVAWWFQSLRGLALFTIAILAAPWVSSFYGKPELLRLFQVSYLSILFTNFVSPRVYVLEKEFRFGRSMLLVQGSSILGTVITVVLAFMVRSVWVLVIGFVAEAAILCLFSYILVPFLPRFRINRECLRELIKFGRGMFGLPILTWISLGADVLVLGKIVPYEMLGMYSLSTQLTSLPVILFSQIINPVLLPGFAQKQDDKKTLCRVVLQITQGIAIFAMPLVAFFSSCASGILLFAYGFRYMAVAVPCGILSVLILVRIECIVPSALYFAVGKPHLHRRFVILRAVIIVALIYPAIIYFGLSGAASVMVLGYSVALLMQVYWYKRFIDLKFSNYLRCHIPGLLLSLPTIITIFLLRCLGLKSPVLTLIAGLAVTSVSLVGGVYILLFPNKFPFTKKKAEVKTNPLSAFCVEDL